MEAWMSLIGRNISHVARGGGGGLFLTLFPFELFLRVDLISLEPRLERFRIACLGLATCVCFCSDLASADSFS